MSSFTRFAWPAMLVTLSMTASPIVARAADTDAPAAQALFDQAKKLMTAGKYAEACPKLEESQRLDPALGTLLNLAECHEKQGRKATAWSEFVEAAAKAQAAGHVVPEKAARERAAALVQQLPKLVIQVASSETAGLEVKRDNIVVGSPQWGVPIPIDSGAHTISASAPGRRTFSTTVTIANSAGTSTIAVPALEQEPVAHTAPAAQTVGLVDVAPAAPESSNSQRVIAIATGGVGVAALVVGSVFGLRSKGKHDDAESHCDATGCDPQGIQLRGDARSAGNLSTVFFVVGAVGLGAGAALWFTAKPTPSTTAELVLGPGAAVVRGTW